LRGFYCLAQALPATGEAEPHANAAAETLITILHTNDTHSQIDPLLPTDGVILVKVELPAGPHW
jgi:2',3'-cyclic-nucleotide 2'-phosphodiesterase (5'-nucleotidase family)